MSGCSEFRSLLESLLDGRGPSFTELGWHAHLGGCAECRELLETEEALEMILASLPEPQLPEALARRVVARLRAERTEEERLERLLSAAGEVAVPDGLAGRVLAGLAERRADPDPLDRLLDADGPPAVPPGLAERVLAAAETERAAVRRAAGRSQSAANVWRAAAAILVAGLAGLLAWSLRPRGESGAPGTTPAVAMRDEEPAEELLAALDVLENWELVAPSDDPDLYAFTDLDAGDEALLELLASELWTEDEDG